MGISARVRVPSMTLITLYIFIQGDHQKIMSDSSSSDIIIIAAP